MTARKAQVIVCPGCDARFMFCRNSHPEIDGCGFESYSIQCTACKARLTAVVDPQDDELLLSKFES
jgi:hypothetical protein